MLPYTPLHHLLLRETEGVPLVMTSGNRSHEPIACEDDDAVRRLAGIADVFLTHDRPIHVRCDDSVMRCVEGTELPLRRSRGYAPQPVTLPFECREPILAVGGQLKATFALGRRRNAFVSHHLGDLDHLDAYRAFVRDIELYEQLFGVHPAVIAHDLHPDYASSRYAFERVSVRAGSVSDGSGQTVAYASGSDEIGPRLVAVQHHHAHLAACMAEHGLDELVLGVTFDGTGYGTDGDVWGGEFLVGDYRRFQRVAHLRYVGMPGGDRAIKEPWRMALAHLTDAGWPADPPRSRGSPVAIRAARRMLERGFNTPRTSSAGRLFDAVAAIAGVREVVSYEGQAAVELEWLAENVAPDGAYPFDIHVAAREDALQVDTRPLARAAAEEARRGVDAAVIARRFHSAMVAMIVAVCLKVRARGGPNVVALTGGVFQNALLTREVGARLIGEGFRVYRHRLVPPGDGGLSLGQLAVAARSALTDN